MKIDITCSKEWFGALVRRCQNTKCAGECPHCVLFDCCGEEKEEGDAIEIIADVQISEE